MKEIFDLIVIGGGAAGLAAAVCAAEKGDHVLILEASSALGRKILASGNGRCNLMNLKEPKYYGDSKFACEVLKGFPASRQIDFWHHLGLRLAEENDGRVYPCTYQAISVLHALKTGLEINHVQTLLQTPAVLLKKEQDIYSVYTEKDAFYAQRVLVATGGPANRKLGGRDDGILLLKPFRIRCVPFFPALTPLNAEKKYISGLSGIRVRCRVRLKDEKGNTLHQEEGEVLFTDYGVSGICIMQCARFTGNGRKILELDLAGRIFPNDMILLNELFERKKRFSEQTPEALLNGILVPKLSFAVLKQAGFSLRGEKLGSVTDEAVRKAAETVRHYKIVIEGVRGLDEAQVSAGGADCQAFDPKTLVCRNFSGLHIAGEVMNTDGDCGGYNLMFAFASGILAGLNGRQPDF